MHPLESSGPSSGNDWLFQTLGEAALGLLWVADTEGHLLYVNNAWQEYTGLTGSHSKPSWWGELIHPAELEAARQKWNEALSHGSGFGMETRYRRASGSYGPIFLRIVPLRTPDGRHHWIGTALDIDDAKLAQEALRRNERDLDDFFENAAIPLHWVGPDGTILRVNQAELDLLGYTRDEYLGRNIIDFHADRDVIDDILRRLSSGEILHDYPARLRCKSGSLVHVLIDSSVFFDNGEFKHTRCFTRDVTNQREAHEATARLAAIVASSTDAIISKTLDGVITSWNAAAARIFGYSSAEMVSQPIYRLIPAEYHDAERALLDQIRRGEPVEISEAERITKDGSRIHISISVSPIRDAQDRVVGASSIKRDITERRRAAETLRQSQERLQLALKAARMGTWWWDVPSNVLTWDTGLQKLYSLGSGETVTSYEQFINRVHADDRGFVESSVNAALHGSGGLDYEFRIVLPDGRVRWLADQGRVVRDQNGKLLYMTGVCMDVTERKQVEERLRQAQRMESVGQLAGGIAHEANNMMSVVLGCADYVLRRSDLSEPVRQDVEQIWTAANRTASITQQLLAFSRRQVLQPQVLDLNDTVRSLEPILTRTLGESRGLRMHLSSGLWQVRADPGQLEQVLINLTLNARDAMLDGGRLTIETMNVVLDEAYVASKSVETLKSGNYAALIVNDTGHGMDRETLSRVFEPFFTTKGVGQGTGLGLSTVYGIVKQSGGFVWAYSEPGLGSTFKLYFPVVPAVEPTIVSPDEPPLARPNEVVLIAEDESMVRAVMARTLRECGYAVLEASDGREALEMLVAAQGKVSLVIADVVMPGLAGRELASRLSEGWPNVPVLFTSGYTGQDVVQRGLLEDGRDFIQKPIAPEPLIRKVREMVDAGLPSP
jgi:two-component system, cell cycle sensor histidine kinase and response regulator CckA